MFFEFRDVVAYIYMILYTLMLIALKYDKAILLPYMMCISRSSGEALKTFAKDYNLSLNIYFIALLHT